MTRPTGTTAPVRLRRRASRGLSIIELMVGITIALFIMAGATLVLTTQLGDNRRLLLEAQLQQDLRTTVDMISRDVRRAGFWSRAYCNIWPAVQDAVNCPAPNRYNILQPASAASGTSQLVYARSTDSEAGGTRNIEDFVVDNPATPNNPRELVGFRWNEAAQSIEYMVGANNWQALTDPTAIRVTRFNLVLNVDDLPAPCDQAVCQVSGPACGGPMVLQSRSILLTIEAQAMHDPNVRRSIRENLQLRNNVPSEQCP